MTHCVICARPIDDHNHREVNECAALKSMRERPMTGWFAQFSEESRRRDQR